MARRRFNICKFRPERVRELAPKELARIRWHLRQSAKVDFIHQARETNPRGLALLFVNEALKVRDTDFAMRRGLYGRPSDPIRSKIEAAQARQRENADRLEKAIWDMQAKRRCPISPGELVARDAIRQGGHDQATIDRLRGKRRPRIR